MSTPNEPGLTPEQAAYLANQQSEQAAASSAGITADSAAVADQMTERGPLLPAEVGIDALMAQLKQQSDMLAAMQSQIGVLQKQQEDANLQSGGPLPVRYAQGAADKIGAAVAQWPAHAEELRAAADAAGALLEHAGASTKGTAPGAPMQQAQSVIGRVFSKLPHVDASAILDDVAAAVEEAFKLHAA